MSKPDIDYKQFISNDINHTRQTIIETLQHYTEKEVKDMFPSNVKKSLRSKLNYFDCFRYIAEIDDYYSPDVSDVSRIIDWISEQLPNLDKETLKIYICYKWRSFVNSHIKKIQTCLKTDSYLIWSLCLGKPNANGWEAWGKDYYERYRNNKPLNIPNTLKK